MTQHGLRVQVDKENSFLAKLDLILWNQRLFFGSGYGGEDIGECSNEKSAKSSNKISDKKAVILLIP